MEFFETLSKTDLFRNLRKKEIFELLERSTVCQYNAGSMILKKGTSDPYIKIVVKGTVFLNRSDGESVTLTEGAYFGELNLLNDSLVAANIYAKSEVDILLISYKDIKSSYSENAKLYGILMENLARVLAKRLTHKNSSRTNINAA